VTTRFKQMGDVLDHTPGTAVASGAVVVMGAMVGVALANIAANQSGSVQVAGVFELPKLAGDVIAQGVDVYWDATPGEVTVTSAGNTLAGKAAYAAGAGITTVQVLLNA
jgi:predicted RecA/RadA family phage recombinase